MHSLEFKYGKDKEAVIHHNSDWSGDAYIVWDFYPNPAYPNVREAHNRVTVPGKLLQSFARLLVECAVEEIESALSSLKSSVQE